jgi:hypothetical protein
LDLEDGSLIPNYFELWNLISTLRIFLFRPPILLLAPPRDQNALMKDFVSYKTKYSIFVTQKTKPCYRRQIVVSLSSIGTIAPKKHCFVSYLTK